MKQTSRSAAGLDAHSTGPRVLGRKLFRKIRFGLVASVLLGALCAATVAPAAWADNEITLHHFTGASDGLDPFAGLTFDSAGNLYGTTYGGGASNYGTVFKLSPASGGGYTYALLHTFTGGSDGEYPQAGVILDSAGNLYGATVGGGPSNHGTVFELSPASGGGYTETVLHGFSGAVASDGNAPYGNLIFDSAGNLYGTTFYGGNINFCNQTGCGSVFKLSPASGGGYTETVLYSFAGGSDGEFPEAGLILDSAGNLYGTTSDGGNTNTGSCSAVGCGTVFKLSPTSGGGYTESVLYRFAGGTDGKLPLAGLILDSAGNLYGTTNQGGYQGYYGTVFKLAPASGGYTETVLYTFTDGSDGGAPHGGLIFDSAGNLYGTALIGGIPTASACAQGCGTVFELSPASGGSYSATVLYGFTGGSDGGNPYAGLIFDSAGNLFSTASMVNGNAQGTVFEIGTGPFAGTVSVPASYNFGNVLTGNTSQVATLTVNVSYATAVSFSNASLSGANSADFSIGANSCAGTIAASKSCTISVTFTPSAAAGTVESATLSIADNAANSPQTIALSGTSIAPVTLSPTSVSFGSWAIGNTSANHTITITNHQPKATTLSTGIAGTNATDFAFNGGTCTSSLAAYGSCTVILTFTPSAAAGTVESATLSITDNAANSPQTIPLSGTSNAPVTLSPTSVSFGAVAAGDTSANHTVTITNHQPKATTLSTGIAGTNATDFAFNGGTCTSSLAAHGSCTVILTFTPSAAVGTAESATLSISDNAVGSPQTDALSGTSAAPVTLTPTTVSFGTVAAGSTSANHTVTITNHQPGAISLNTAIIGADPSDFALNGGTCTTSLKAFGSCTVILDFSPGASGNRSATLSIIDSPDSNSPHTINLIGKGG